ncbi:LppX_LprAFG lipoprotein [Nocardioides sp.]|uniref:DUF7537 family lipoprotein n=1 Tax=Nocardioides sp. TaxID=35761 RepID=UPI003568623A
MSRSVHVRRGVAALLLPLGLLGAAGCGGEDTEATDDPGASASVDVDAGGDQVEAGSAVDVSDFVALLAQSLEGGGTAHLTMEIEGGPSSISAEGDIDYEDAPPSMMLSMTMAGMSGQTMEMRMVDGIVYLKADMTGQKYLSLDTTDPSNPLGSALTDQLDPRSMFTAMEESIESVTYVGEDEVDGEEMRQYRVQLDSAAMADQLGPDASAGDLPEVVTYDMWFDEDGRYRQMSVDLGASNGTARMTFSDWGEPVTITAPPESDIMEMPSMG